MRRDESGLPFVIGGLLLAALLIGVSFQLGAPNSAVLSQQFVPRPRDPSEPTLAPFELPQVTLPDLPPDAQTRISDLTEQLAGGRPVPALTPVASGASVRVTIDELRRSGERVSIRGSLANISQRTVAVAPEAFLFRDSAGVTYATEGTGASQLAPGEETSFDLAVPLPSGRGLTMIVNLPPDPPLEQVLVVEVKALGDRP
jgi:hypothetical protein